MPRLKRWLAPPILVNYGVSLFVFIVGLGLTVWAWHLAIQNQAASERRQFRHVTQQVVNSLNDRFNDYATLVRSGQALFMSSQEVGPSEWRAFVQALFIEKKYPAIVAFDFIAYVPDKSLATYEREMQRDRPGFNLHHIGKGRMHCIVQYEAPLRENSPGPGLDACKLPASHAAMLQTLAHHDIVVSEHLQLTTRPLGNQTGIVMSGPIFRNGGKTRDQLMGWSTAVLAVHRILSGVVPPGSNAGLDVVEIADSGARQPLPYRNKTQAPVECGASFLTTPCLSAEVPLTLPGGRQWTLILHEPEIAALGAWKVAGAGLVISLLLGLIFLRWGRVKTRALALANEMTGALRQSENLLSSVTNNIFEGIYRSDAEHGLIYLNKSMATMFGYREVEEMLAGSSPKLYADPRRRGELVELLEKNGQYRGEEVEFVRRDGSRFIGVNNALAVYDDDGNIACWDGAISDITARKAVEERVWYLARHDSLTGLANRASFRERVRQEISQAARVGGRFAILFLDLDRFKTVNDYLGHSAGDKLLKAVSQRIQGCLGRDDVASRQGGDEFLILLADVDPAAMAKTAEEMLRAVAGGYTIDAHEIVVTPSIGISLYPAHGDTVEMLIRSADAAMYHAKARGRFNVQLFTPELDIDRQVRAGLENDLRDALSQNQLTLHYQPQVDLETGRIIAGEALLRWYHPTRGMVPPCDFIPVAEQSGLIVPIGEWVLREACRQNREWQLAGLSIVPIAVNISAIQFLRRTLDQTIFGALNEAGLEYRYLELELTETVVMRDIGRTVEVLDKLQSSGIRISIDDFGTGYSSLSYLRWFKINKLKIDQSFVRELSTNPDDVAIIDAIIGLARSFRLRVVAEGVETAAQLALMREHDCDDVQGYYFSRPVPAEAFARLLRTGISDPGIDAAVAD